MNIVTVLWAVSAMPTFTGTPELAITEGGCAGIRLPGLSNGWGRAVLGSASGRLPYLILAYPHGLTRLRRPGACR